MTFVAKIPREQVVRFRVTPIPGAYIPADMLGGQLTGFSDLLREIGKKDGLITTTAIMKIATLDDGAIEVEFAVLNLAPEVET
jgi:hypothetical protein